MTIGAGEQVVKLKKIITTGENAGTYEVFIQSAKVEENITDPNLISIERSFIGVDQTTKGAGTLFVKLNRFKHTFNIQGYLSNEDGSGNESYASAKLVKDDLIKYILYGQGDIELHYRDYIDSDYSTVYGDNSTVPGGIDHVKCALSKVSITDASLRADYMSGTTVQVARYNIDLELFRGKTK